MALRTGPGWRGCCRITNELHGSHHPLSPISSQSHHFYNHWLKNWMCILLGLEWSGQGLFSCRIPHYLVLLLCSVVCGDFSKQLKEVIDVSRLLGFLLGFWLPKLH